MIKIKHFVEMKKLLKLLKPKNLLRIAHTLMLLLKAFLAKATPKIEQLSFQSGHGNKWQLCNLMSKIETWDSRKEERKLKVRKE